MKRLIIPIFIILSFLPTAPVGAALPSGVRCPVPPKSQRNINHIFFSFYKKSANIYSHIPQNLVLLDSLYTEDRPKCLTSQTYNAFISLYDALLRDTGQRLVVASAWRSTKTQMYFAKARGEFAAPPGRSEHQLGVAVDLGISGSKEGELFGDSVVYQWMKAHASEYGFVQSFTTEDPLVTGIPAEPWHWRFVGKTIATKVTNEKLNISKYLYERKEAKKKGLSY
ncbi:MAG: M15 family metallopeptidase [Patescibacteria group bacterium]